MYKSTRSNEQATSKEAVLKGLANDGGLYVMDDIDKIKLDLNNITNNTYIENAVYVMEKLLPDYTEKEIRESAKKAYSKFKNEEVTPLKKVGGVFVLELFHGPTSAFKDVALTFLPELMSIALKDTNKKALILTATSGDTGKAALSGFQDVDNIKIAVFYPHNKVSKIQYLQMSTQQGKNTKVFGVKGNFDDTQNAVKIAFCDEKIRKEADERGIILTSANSINVGRLVPQVVYYFESYKQLVKGGYIKPGEEISFSVPTGNFGDVLAGYYAKLMGLPVKKLYVATNENNVLTDFINTGIYDKNRDFIQTISPSMDILISSNLERLIYFIYDKDSKKVASLMNDLKTTGRFEIDKEHLAKLQETFGTESISQPDTKKVIGKVFNDYGYLLDTHSAISYGVAHDAKERTIVSLATASPYKFSQVVLSSVGTEEVDEFLAMSKLEKISKTKAPENLRNLQSGEILHKAVIDRNEIVGVVEDIINDKN